MSPRPSPRRKTRRPRVHVQRKAGEPGPWNHGALAVVGIVGGIGSGKSQVASALERRGAFVIDADRVGHALIDQRPAREAVLKRFGNNLLIASDDPDVAPAIDRALLGEIVFKSAPDLKALEEILHPRMRQTFSKAIERVVRKGSHPAVVLDAAVLFEAGWNDLCDLVIFVDAPRSHRLERLSGSRGWTEADLAVREARQWPLDQKVKAADIRLVNDSTPEALNAAVDRFWATRIAPHAAVSRPKPTAPPRPRPTAAEGSEPPDP